MILVVVDVVGVVSYVAGVVVNVGIAGVVFVFLLVL